MSRAAMQQALEALMMMMDKYEEYACPEYACPARDHADAAITTLRKALAEPEQEQPVAWLDIDDKGQKHGLRYYSDGNSDEVPLYTAPTPRKPQTTHWEGCEAVHPECRKPDTDCHAQGICQRSGYSIAPTPRKPEQPYDQTALELCGVCGWRTLIPGDACLNCERSKQPEQEPVVWRSIETAPKDRTVLVCGRHATMPRMAKWNAQYEWFESFDGVHLYDLTHWMLLPPVPVTHGIGEQHE